MYIGREERDMGHLRDVGMDYFEHLGLAWRSAFLLVLAAGALVVHGVFPFLLVRTGSDILKRVSFPEKREDKNG
jgi:hypothetical protein